MKVALFLGSGISLPSGLPTVEEITQKLLYSDWHQHSSRLFCPGLPPNTPVGNNDITKKLQQFLHVVLSYSRAYFKNRNITDIQYEDLYFFVSQLKDEECKFILNPLVKNARNEIYNGLDYLLEGCSENLGSLTEKACNLIQSVCYHALSIVKDVTPKGFDLLHQIHADKSIKRIDIFTVNHDLLIENFLTDMQIPFTDGFDLDSGKGNVRFENFELFDSISHRIRLFKLHGSIDMFSYTSADKKTRMPGKYTNDGRYACDSEGNTIFDDSPYPLFVTGTHNKPNEYMSGIYFAMLNKFYSAIREHDVIIMSGYGWGDGAINSFLMSWLRNSVYKRMIILHKKPFDIFKNPRHGIRWDSNEFREAGRIRIKKKWLCCTKLHEIKWILNKWESAAGDQQDIAEELRRRNPPLDDLVRMLESDNSE
jgi:hypothetical protein